MQSRDLMQKLPSANSKITLKLNEPFIIVLPSLQVLKLFIHNKVYSFHISTAKNGLGEAHNSYKTPRGWHYVRAKITCSDDTIYLKGRRPSLQKTDITSKILWLKGLETHNHNPKEHSMLRYIYCHGVPYSFLKSPISKGCINMAPIDIEKLYSLIPKYCKFYIAKD